MRTVVVVIVFLATSHLCRDVTGQLQGQGFTNLDPQRFAGEVQISVPVFVPNSQDKDVRKSTLFPLYHARNISSTFVVPYPLHSRKIDMLMLCFASTDLDR